jgi:hypothetical protein
VIGQRRNAGAGDEQHYYLFDRPIPPASAGEKPFILKEYLFILAWPSLLIAIRG